MKSVLILLGLLGSHYAEESLSFAIPAGTSRAYAIGRNVGHVRSIPVESLQIRPDNPSVVVTSLNNTDGTGVLVTTIGNNSATYSFTHTGNNSHTSVAGGYFVSNNTAGSFGFSSSSSGTFPGTSVFFPFFQGLPILHPVFTPPNPTNVVFRSLVRPGEATRVLALPPPYPQFFYNADKLQLTAKNVGGPQVPNVEPQTRPQDRNISPPNLLDSRFGFGLFSRGLSF